MKLVGPRSVVTCQVLGVEKVDAESMRWITGVNSRCASSSSSSWRSSAGKAES